mmetsp:Transcript_9627/g.23842  ORF Transcript_9627/g.23842 Transcript_9627/m.23842 type:complete len:110 (+) Transcript_9627:129-458(+)
MRHLGVKLSLFLREPTTPLSSKAARGLERVSITLECEFASKDKVLSRRAAPLWCAAAGSSAVAEVVSDNQRIGSGRARLLQIHDPVHNTRGGLRHRGAACGKRLLQRQD